MKRIFLLLTALFTLCNIAQGELSISDAVAKQKKITYTCTETVADKSKAEIYSRINRWAKKNYGKDVFVSTVSSNKRNGTIFIGSKIELLLSETDSTILKYKMNISCSQNKYTIKVSDLSYQYDPQNNKRFKIYPAEDVISQQGKNNKVAIIKDPELFYKATYGYMETLFEQIKQAAFND